MVTLTGGVGRAGLAALAALALAVTAPAGAHATGHGVDRPGQPVVQTFLPWVDSAWYVSAPDDGLEAGAADWTLDGGAATVEGNERYFVGGVDDQRSLALPRGASAITAAICIGVEHPTIRFFDRNSRSPDSMLAVSVVFRDPDGQSQSLPIGRIAGSSARAPAPVLPLTVNLLSLLGDQHAAFHFAPADDRGEWSIDGLYVDPAGTADRPGGATDWACLVRSRRNAQAPPVTARP